jgi:hypothetical protein
MTQPLSSGPCGARGNAFNENLLETVTHASKPLLNRGLVDRSVTDHKTWAWRDIAREPRELLHGDIHVGGPADYVLDRFSGETSCQRANVQSGLRRHDG